MLKRCDCVLVHNDSVLSAVKIACVPSDRLFVLEDVPPRIKEITTRSVSYGPRPLIVFPACFGRDEPISEVFDAASLAPQWTFVVTGNPAKATGRHSLTAKPSNVILPGYLSLDDFEALIADADIIVGLTRFEGIQLSVCNEALGFSKAMVLSKTKILQQLFSGPSVFVDSADPKEIVDGIRRALEQRTYLEQRARELCIQRLQQWESGQAARVKESLPKSMVVRPAVADGRAPVEPMKVIITWDYELFFGRSTGTVLDCLINPTDILLRLARHRSAKMVFFVDAGFLFKLHSQYGRTDRLSYDFDMIRGQLRRIVSEGHEIQLHVHSHWEDSVWDGEMWRINTSRYSLVDFDESQIEDIISKYLAITKECSGYRQTVAFRAGGWNCQPFSKIGSVLQSKGILFDSSVYPGGKRSTGVHRHDFIDAPECSSWRFDADPLKPEEHGRFLEVPISAIRTSPDFYWRFAVSSKFGGAKHSMFGKGSAIALERDEMLTKLIRSTITPVLMDGYKSSLLLSAFNKYLEKQYNIFVPMGHPKAITPFSIQCLDKFLSNIAHKSKFIGFSDLL